MFKNVRFDRSRTGCYRIRSSTAAVGCNGNGVFAIIAAFGSETDCSCGSVSFYTLSKEIMVVFARGAAECFEDYDEENYADAGTGEHAFGCDVPLGREETLEIF